VSAITLFVQTTDGAHHVHILDDFNLSLADKICDDREEAGKPQGVYVARALLFRGTNYPELVRPRAMVSRSIFSPGEN